MNPLKTARKLPKRGSFCSVFRDEKTTGITGVPPPPKRFPPPQYLFGLESWISLLSGRGFPGKNDPPFGEAVVVVVIGLYHLLGTG